ncbi:MAG: phosphoenolpyruvate--protein phosphotransferase [Chthoniobacteraceae bacterium]
MVGIVIVSHSRPLAIAARDIILATAGKDLPVAVAAGAGEDHCDFGTDAMEILEAVNSVMSDEGVLVLMDMGSAVLSAETALDFLDEEVRARVLLSSAPLIEGGVAAGVAAHLGASLKETAREAAGGLRQKMEHLPADDEAVPPIVDAPQPAGQGPVPSITLVLTNEHGFHARPVARFIKECARLDAEITVENLTTGKGPASGRSFGALTALEILQGQEMRVNARGPQAEQALEAVRKLAAERFGDAEPASAPAKQEETQGQGQNGAGESPRAQPVAMGIAIGRAEFVQKVRPSIPENRVENPTEEWKKMQGALSAARAGLLKEAESIKGRVNAAAAGIFDAQALLLEDPELLEKVKGRIMAEKLNAPRVWLLEFQAVAAQYEKMKDEYLRQRASDVMDAGWRVMTELGINTGHALAVDEGGILVADDLAPAEVSQLNAAKVAGVILLDGGRTSHSAILLRMLGIPAIAQARRVLPAEKISSPITLAFDGATGEVWVEPDAGKIADLQKARDVFQQTRERELEAAQLQAVTRDGHRVEILANATTEGDATAALAAGAEGVGLLRTEFLFLHRDSAPGEDEQVAALEPVLKVMEGRPVVIRTLDAGGDKELGYLGLPREANPFLGVRALRVSLCQPDLFRPQLRALLRVGVGRDLRIMFPMVSEPDELRSALAALQSAHDALERENVPHAWPVQTGIMMEVPSAALLAEPLAAECSFFSIGTNDLTQYTLAADRGNPGVSQFQDALHPAVLLLVRRIVEGAHAHGRRVAVCGEAAGELQSALVFIALGVDELSMSPPMIPKIKAAIREVDYGELKSLGEKLLLMGSATGVRKAVAGFLAR